MKLLAERYQHVNMPSWAYHTLRRLNAMAADSGVMLMDATAEEFVEAVATIDAEDGALLGSHCDYRVNPAVIGSTDFLIGYHEGRVVTTNTARVYPDTHLPSILRSRAVWFDDPFAAERSAILCNVIVPAAEDISGRLVHSGTTWVHPTFRGDRQPHWSRLVSITARIARILSTAGGLQATHVFSTCPSSLARKGFVGHLGMPRSFSGLSIRSGPNAEMIESHLNWATASEIQADALRVARTGLLQVPNYPWSVT